MKPSVIYVAPGCECNIFVYRLSWFNIQQKPAHNPAGFLLCVPLYCLNRCEWAVCGYIFGFVVYAPWRASHECEIAVLESLRQRAGVGGALINAVIQKAKSADCRRVWLITTNDNTLAIRFYQRFGFELRAVHINAMEQSRRLKPQIPMVGADGIPI